jgi:endonuclease/exonuclease/phosphatase family metal-dependent hydrolase
MRPIWKTLLPAACGSLLCFASTCNAPASAGLAAPSARPFDGTLSVLTYNIEGVPWPFAWDRPPAFARIADRLRALRRTGRDPQIVLLQEAFTGDAEAIGREAGYPYVVAGPSETDVNRAPPSAADSGFEAAASWWHGEIHGKLVGSGLMLLSDYPILRARRMAYPAFACAGFDCLANKGALLVTVRIPGAPSPVDIVTTHLNSRYHSWVSDDRSLYAYRREAAFLSAFVGRWHDPSYPLIVAGDFNAGWAPPRWSALRSAIASWPGAAPFQDAISDVAQRRTARGIPLPGDMQAILHRAEDWQFFTSGRSAALAALAVRIPFGHEPDGTMLSDHIGYTALYRLGPQAGRRAAA